MKYYSPVYLSSILRTSGRKTIYVDLRIRDICGMFDARRDLLIISAEIDSSILIKEIKARLELIKILFRACAI